MTVYIKKIIETSIPLETINANSAYEKLPGIGSHPRGIHHWWARRPFAAARAVIFAQLVNDPVSEFNITKKGSMRDALKKKESLFKIIEKLSDWKNSDDEELMKLAYSEIKKSWLINCRVNNIEIDGCALPFIYDPFCGGGAIPTEAGRLGLSSVGSDLNPVAALITKSMIELPYAFNVEKPYGEYTETDLIKLNKNKKYKRSLDVIAEDVRRYGYWVWKIVNDLIGNNWKNIEITDKHVGINKQFNKYLGRELPVVAWIWARTVESPDPFLKGQKVPLIKNFLLSKKNNTKLKVEVKNNTYSIRVTYNDKSKNTIGTIGRSGGRCVISNTPIPFDYIREQGKKGKIGFKLVAIALQGDREKIYVEPDEKYEKIIKNITYPDNVITTKLPSKALGFRVQEYGMLEHKDLFLNRQMLGLITFSECIPKVIEKITNDLVNEGVEKGKRISEGGSGAIAYAECIATYIALSIDRTADFNNSLTGWRAGNEKIMGLFNRHAVPMVWDFGEANMLGKNVGGFINNIEYQSKCIEKLPAYQMGKAYVEDASSQKLSLGAVISTDPPYYDNIGYADLSDFFYVWMRNSLKSIYPNYFKTVLVPKSTELIASPIRHKSKKLANDFFLKGMTQVFTNLSNTINNLYPMTVYYAFKQSELSDNNRVSSGWEAFLSALINSGLRITGTWPLRSEQSTRMIGMGNNALASSIVLTCRPNPNRNGKIIPKRSFMQELKAELSTSLDHMRSANIAAVDLEQSIIGPGIGVFSRYEKVVENDGSIMSVRSALILINQILDEVMEESENEFDNYTRFCLTWFSINGFEEGAYGDANTLAQAKNVNLNSTSNKTLISKNGKVKLINTEDLPDNWNSSDVSTKSIWEITHYLYKILEKNGEQEAAKLLLDVGERAESCKKLAYRCYNLCVKKEWINESRVYNSLITAWSSMSERAMQV